MSPCPHSRTVSCHHLPGLLLPYTQSLSCVGLTIMSPAGGGPSPHHWVLLTCHYPRPNCSVPLALLHDLSPCNEVRAGTLPAIPNFLLHFHCCDKMHRQSKSKRQPIPAGKAKQEPEAADRITTSHEQRTGKARMLLLSSCTPLWDCPH